MSAQAPPPKALPSDIPEQQQSLLLNLPVELQLNIYELALISPDSLLLNCPCDSWYHRNYDAWDNDKEAWASGTKHAPSQPGLTQTCAFVRKLTLPIFYQENRFLAHYCHSADISMATGWLNAIGPINRALLRHLWLFDENPRQDVYCPEDIEGAKETLTQRFAAVMGPPVIEGDVQHHVTFPEQIGAADDGAMLAIEA
ncbi:hypothetical protein B0A55_01978 [Friedmanniomyces simplex]|uniref:F-box domain-containing protein n=1 Tax=Friedmanniomyces simplex TaxID=329884 RepID=A0A4U0XME9_9PEZI|nr:hypothetical protein B0A55_01978 [Friedmanniomyces simplex]